MELNATNRRRPSLAAGGKSQPRRGIHLVLMVSEIRSAISMGMMAQFCDACKRTEIKNVLRLRTVP